MIFDTTSNADVILDTQLGKDSKHQHQLDLRRMLQRWFHIHLNKLTLALSAQN